jgi:hypothetical protein
MNAVSVDFLRWLFLGVTVMVTSTTAFGLDRHVSSASRLLVSELATVSRVSLLDVEKKMGQPGKLSHVEFI